MPRGALDYQAAAPDIDAFLFGECRLQYLVDLTPSQLNDLYAALDWHDRDDERGNKQKLIAWVLKNFPELKHPTEQMRTKTLLDASMQNRPQVKQGASREAESQYDNEGSGSRLAGDSPTSASQAGMDQSREAPMLLDHHETDIDISLHHQYQGGQIQRGKSWRKLDGVNHDRVASHHSQHSHARPKQSAYATEMAYEFGHGQEQPTPNVSHQPEQPRLPAGSSLRTAVQCSRTPLQPQLAAQMEHLPAPNVTNYHRQERHREHIAAARHESYQSPSIPTLPQAAPKEAPAGPPPSSHPDFRSSAATPAPPNLSKTRRRAVSPSSPALPGDASVASLLLPAIAASHQEVTNLVRNEELPGAVRVLTSLLELLSASSEAMEPDSLG